MSSIRLGLGLGLGLCLAVAAARAEDVYLLEESLIEASPLSGFSERAALWPVDEATTAATNTETKPVDLYNQVPGLYAKEAGVPGVSIRGSGAGDRVLRLYEGTSLNLADGLGASEIFIPTEIIHQLRIFKGPASVFFGSSAVGGAIDHRTRPLQRPELRVSATATSIDDGSRQIFAGTPLSKSSQISAFHSRDNGRYPYSGSRGSGMRDGNANEITRVVGVSQARIGDLSLRSHLLVVRTHGETPGMITAPSRSTFSYDGILASVEATRPITTQTHLSLRVSDVRQWGLFDQDSAQRSSSFVSQTSFHVDVRALLGAQLVSRTFADTRGDQLKASYLGQSEFQRLQLELGQSLEYALSPSLSLTPAVRYLPSDGRWVQAIGLMRNDVHTRQWLTFTEGYRTASLSDLYTQASYFQGNPNLQPEISKAFELGLSVGDATNGPRFASVLYTVTYSNFHETLALNPTTTTKINSGQATVSGIDHQYENQWGAIRVNASLGYLDARNNSTASPLRLSPRWQTKLGVGYQAERWRARTDLTSWSEFADRNPLTGEWVTLPAWATVDVIAFHTLLRDWEISYGVRNIFDQPRELTVGYPEPQRRWHVSLRGEF